MPPTKLSDYRKKRDFSRTPEPAGAPLSAASNRFVVHKHHATADHYDLRLELDGVLKSWAVPKGPSLNPADKRYAVQTEDHPLEYIDFEGVIPEGEYGGGPMIVWDTGDWAPMGDAADGLSSGDFKFRLWGEKLKGGWMLVRLRPKPDDNKANWLLFKERDPSADTETDILEARPESVKSGLRIEELVAEPLPVPQSATTSRPTKLQPSRLRGAVRATRPERIKPQLATPSAEPPRGPGWLHEIKLDGYRTAAHVQAGSVRFITRAGLDWTRRYGVLGRAFGDLPCKEAVIDGEIVVLDEQGVTHFADLQQALSEGATERLTFYAFDLLHLDGYNLRKVELVKRKAMLARLLGPVVSANSALQLSDHIEGDGVPLFERASEMGLEGIVSKRSDAPYVEARTATWLKTKALRVGDFPIVGYTVSDAAGGLAALGVGEWEEGELHYRGKVGTGFDAGDLRTLLARLEPLRTTGPALERAPRELIPVRPVLAAHVHFANRTRDNSLRHAVFKGLREPEITAAPQAERQRLITDADLASVFLTNPTRPLFGKAGPTKLDLAVYYARVGDFMLPHLFNRPVTLVRSPSGKAEDIFYQRHPFTGMPKSVQSFEVPKADGENRRYLSIEDARGYLALAQFGVIELHTWGSRREHLEQPDRIVFDLDPGDGITWRNIVAAALAVRTSLEAMQLTPFVKTSGGKGLHVVAPLRPRLDWKQIHAATGDIANTIAASNPDTFTTNMAKEKRKRRIFIDFHRNARSATAAAPYSLRARSNLPASTPVNWSDLESIDAPEDLNYSTLPEFLASSGDPWSAIDEFAADLKLNS